VINSAIIHFPAGCNSLVEVKINHGTNQILPTPVTGGTASTGIALDDTTQSFGINERIALNETLEVVVTNHDAANPHTISVIIMIEEDQKYTGP